MNSITVEIILQAPVEFVWESWTNPLHITQWCFASDDWCAPRAENNLEVGNTFKTRMEAKDGSFGFDFSGTYLQIQKHKLIEYVLDDHRKVQIYFETENGTTKVKEVFQAEDQNSAELQQKGWQMILDNFKKYTEKIYSSKV